MPAFVCRTPQGEGFCAPFEARFFVLRQEGAAFVLVVARGVWLAKRRFRNDDGLNVVAVCFEGCCGSMCWPADRPGAHAAAGAAARGVRGIGGFNPLRGATTGVVIRRRAVSGETARGGFCFERFFHTLGAWERHRIVSSSPCAPCLAKRRFAFSPMGSHARLAAEIPDIFIPLSRNENSGMTTLFFCFEIAPLREHVLAYRESGHSARRHAVAEIRRGGFPQLEGKLINMAGGRAARELASEPASPVLGFGASDSPRMGSGLPALAGRFRIFSFRYKRR